MPAMNLATLIHLGIHFFFLLHFGLSFHEFGGRAGAQNRL